MVVAVFFVPDFLPLQLKVERHAQADGWGLLERFFVYVVLYFRKRLRFQSAPPPVGFFGYHPGRLADPMPTTICSSVLHAKLCLRDKR